MSVQEEKCFHYPLSLVLGDCKLNKQKTDKQEKKHKTLFLQSQKLTEKKSETQRNG